MEARKACAAGRVERGIELLAQLIAESGDPNAVFNQARCYQANGRNEQALARFREYLRIAENVQVGEADMVRRFIEELEEIVERKRRSPTSPQPSTVARTAAPAARTPPATPNRPALPVSGWAAVAPPARARGPIPPASPASTPSPSSAPNRAAAPVAGLGAAMPKVSTPNRPAASGSTDASTTPAPNRLANGTPNRPPAAAPAPGRMAAVGSMQPAAASGRPATPAAAPGRTAAPTSGQPAVPAPGRNAAPAPTRIASATTTPASASPAPAPPAAPAKDLAARDPGASAAPNIVAQSEPAKPVDRSRRWRIVAVTTAAASVVPLAMGIYYWRYANRIEREIETQTGPLSAAELDSKLRRGSTAINRQWISYALAGTMLAGSGALYLFGPARRVESASAQLDVSPLITDRAAGALVTGRF